MKFFALTVVGLIFASSAVDAEEVGNARLCSKNTQCEIFDLNIEPCAEASQNKPCQIPHGVNSTIKFSYKTKFSSTVPKTRMYAETLLVDLPFLDMKTNACLYTKCPIEAEAQQDYEYHLFVAPKYPRSTYTVKLKIWNGEHKASSKDECCFKFNIEIV